MQQPVEEASYFSIRQFVQDQYNLHHGIPYTFKHILTLNSKRDTAYVSVDSVDWGAIFKTFVETDISDKKYASQYNETMFTDDMTSTINFVYEAKDPKLFTQRVQLSVDGYTHMTTHVYIETQKEARGYTRTQKLLFIPRHVIQIQEFENSAVGPSKELIAEYRFLEGLDD